MRQQKSVPLTGAVAVGAIFLAVVCVAAAALLVAARHAPEADAQPLDIAAVPSPASKVPAVKPQAQRPAASSTPAPASRTAAAGTTAPARTFASPANAAATATPVTPSPMPARALAVDATAAKSTMQQPELVTITGCLERDDAVFRLKNTEGVDAPKARSWKSAFLKKRSASIELVDATRAVELVNHIGQRVRLTGMLADREMRVRSLERVAMSCSN